MQANGTPDNHTLRFAIPKGRMYDGVARLLAEAGLELRSGDRDYRPSLGIDGVETKILKPRAIVEMLADGTRDLGFAGTDWVAECRADLVPIVDTGLDRVRLVVAAPATILEGGALPSTPLRVASEYTNLAQAWIDASGRDAAVVRSYGATEVLPPEDADCIIDNTATGSTLVANGLVIVDEVMKSSTQLYASRAAYEHDAKRPTIDRIAMLVRSVLEARTRVMVEFNVEAGLIEDVLSTLPCMRAPTVSQLRSVDAFAVRAAVKRRELAEVVPWIKSAGGTDIVVSQPGQIVP